MQKSTPRRRRPARTDVLALVRISNAWVLRDREGRTFLIDTGHRVERTSLVRSLGRLGVSKPGDLTAILLTHRHSDHAGNAAWLRERFRCPVVAHPGDAAVLEERAARPRLASRGAMFVHDALCHVEDRFPARTAVDEAYDAGTFRWGFEVVHVGGHTEGSVLLVHEPSATLFTGDALLAGFPAQRLAVRLRLAVPEYSLDAARCREATLAFLAEGRALETLCAGHGPIVRRGLDAQLARLRAAPNG